MKAGKPIIDTSPSVVNAPLPHSRDARSSYSVIALARPTPVCSFASTVGLSSSWRSQLLVSGPMLAILIEG